MPVWSFHGANDTTMLVSYDDDAVTSLRNVGASINYTRYSHPTAGHFISRMAYETPGLVIG